MDTAPRRLRIEEEFHLVDTATRTQVPRAEEVLAQLGDSDFGPELQSSVVQSKSELTGDLAELRAELLDRRAQLTRAAEAVGAVPIAAGTLPVAVADPTDTTDTTDYRTLEADYALLAREQLVCGLQIDVELTDRDEATAVSSRVARFLPVFQAIAASSPFSPDGSDTGYAASRFLVWMRWPTAGPAPWARDAAEYDRIVSALGASGVVGAGQDVVYFDVRPAPEIPSVELRVADSCPAVDSAILVAALFRALVSHEVRGLRAGQRYEYIDPTMLRAMQWRAAKSGLEGELVDPWSGEPRPASAVVRELVDLVREDLASTGDENLVDDLVAATLHTGSSAFRQRRALRRRGRIADVVDMLAAETTGALTPESTVREGGLGGVLGAFVATRGLEDDRTYDEAVDEEGMPRRAYRELFDTLLELGVPEVRGRQIASERDARIGGVTFRVKGAKEAQVFPWDVVPRVIDSAQWNRLAEGISQRARALDAFLDDVYTTREIVRAGVVSEEVLDRAPGYRLSGQAARPGEVRAHIMGADLVCAGPGRWLTLEDNARMPSGVAFAEAQRGLTTRHFPELVAGLDLHDPSEAYGMIRETLLAAAPPAAGDDVVPAVVTAGRSDSGYFEQKMIAQRAGLELVTPEELLVSDGRVYRARGSHKVTPLDVLYVRMEEDMLLTSRGADGEVLHEKLFEALSGGGVTITNALGNGVADDKAIYALVPEMIRFYLGEEQLLESVPTYLCADRDQRDLVLERLDELVVKPIDGYGGAGITIGPECSAEELDTRREELLTQPERYIAQEVVGLSTLPAFDGVEFQRRHVDLRAFVHLRRENGTTTAHVVPSGLTRVAPAGSMIVNSSRGGGGKDTWILR